MAGGEIARLYATIGADTNGFTRGLGGVKKNLGSLGGFAKAAGLAVAGGLAAGVAGLGVFAAKSLDMASDFQDQMAVLSKAADGVDLQSLHDVALQMGQDTQLIGINASESAETLTNLYKAGLTTTEIFGDLNAYMNDTASLSGAVRAAIDLQAASELNLASAGDAVVVSMKTFGISAEEASEKITNNFVAAADASVMSVQDIVDALENVGPTANTFGFKLDEVNTALAILSTRGIKGAEAGTALKSAMMNIMRPTDKVTEALDALNVSLYYEDGSMKSLTNIVSDLSVALAEEGQVVEYVDEATGKTITTIGRLTEEQRNNYMQTLAGSYGIKALATLVDEGTAGWENMTDAISNASTAQEIAAAKAQTLSAKMQAFEGVVETIKIKVGEKLLPIVTKLTEWAADFADKHGDQLVELFGRIADWLGEVIPQAIDFLIGLLGEFRDAWPQIQQIVAPVMEGIIAAVSAGLDAVRSLWENVLGPIVNWIQQHWDQISGIFGTALEAITTLFSGFAALFSGDWNTFAESLRSVAETIWEGIKSLFSLALQALLDAIAGFGPSLLALFAQIWNDASNTVQMVLGIIGAAWDNFWASVRTVLETLGAQVSEAWNNFWNGIKETVDNIWQGILGFIEGVVNGVIDIINGMIRTFNDTIGQVTGQIPELEHVALTTASQVQKTFEETQIATEGFSHNTMAAVVDLVAGVASEIESKAPGITDPLMSEFQSFQQRVSAVANSVMSAINQILGGIGDVNNTPINPNTGGGGGGGGNNGGGGGAPNGAFASGGAFSVPIGFPNDSYRIGVQTGEDVFVRPRGASGGGMGNVYVTVQIDRVGDEIDVEHLAWRVARAIQARA